MTAARREEAASFCSYVQSTHHLLVFSPAELCAGGDHVHAARSRYPWPSRRSQFTKLHLALFLPIHRSSRAHGRDRDAEGSRAGHSMAIGVRLVVLDQGGLVLAVCGVRLGAAIAGRIRWKEISTTS